ncbi:MAG: serine/threonine protein kinase [Lentisphaeria bacterium]|nr:serine/threonine protein kinase [Lentisphaeria bacterium]
MSDAPAELRISCRNCGARLDVSELEPFTVIECPGCGTRLRIPKRFDRYILEKVCGRGTNTVVYRAQDPRLGRRVAVKVLNASGSDAEELGERFLAEAKLVARLNHPGILPIYNCAKLDGKPYLVTRFMEWGDLENLRARGELPPSGTLLRIVTRIAEALQYANQSAKVVHHDVKPGNILLAQDYEARLGDFDLADVRELRDLSPCLGWGTPAYTSPERLYHGGEDVRGDIFSLGVTLYDLLGGALPFGGEGNTDELYERRREMAFPALSTLRPELPRELSDLVTSMLDFSPERRPGYVAILRVLNDCLRTM